jgi:hypothetical protein
MKTPNPASITATFVSAILSLILPASAMAADADFRHVEPAPVYGPSNERAPPEPFRDDPIMDSRWGPGDPNLVLSKFHVPLWDSPKDRSSDRSPVAVPADPRRGRP